MKEKLDEFLLTVFAYGLIILAVVGLTLGFMVVTGELTTPPLRVACPQVTSAINNRTCSYSYNIRCDEEGLIKEVDCKN